MRMVFLFIVGLGCGPKVTPPLPEAAAPTPAPQIPKAKAVKVPELLDLTCTAQSCQVLTGSGTRELDIASLTLGPPTPATPPPDFSVTVNDNPAPLAVRWNQQIAGGWRSPFQEQIPTRTGGRVVYMRSMQAGTARIVRIGGGMRAQPAPTAPGPAAYRRWLALHPSGEQAYLAPWPHTEIIAIEPDQLLTGWRLDLEAPTLGLFIDETGTYLIGETGAEPSEDRLLDYSGGPLKVEEGQDPAGDPKMAKLPRPRGTHTIVVDLERQALVAQLPGTFQRWVPVPNAVLIATTQAVARLPLKAKP